MTNPRIGGEGRIRRIGVSSGRRRLVAATTAVLLTVVGGVLRLAAPARANTGTGSTQSVTFTPSPQLSIAASAVSLGSVTPASSVPVTLGSVAITDTLDDGVDWSASVAASNCFLPTSGLPAGLQTANATIPSTALTYAAPSGAVAATVPLSTTEVTATGGGTSQFAAASGGSLVSPTFSSPVGVASTNAYSGPSPDPNALDNNGTWTLAPSLNLDLTGSGFVPISSAYTCFLQYTIVG